MSSANARQQCVPQGGPPFHGHRPHRHRAFSVQTRWSGLRSLGSAAPTRRMSLQRIESIFCGARCLPMQRLASRTRPATGTTDTSSRDRVGPRWARLVPRAFSLLRFIASEALAIDFGASPKEFHPQWRRPLQHTTAGGGHSGPSGGSMPTRESFGATFYAPWPSRAASCCSRVLKNGREGGIGGHVQSSRLGGCARISSVPPLRERGSLHVD